jgi:hypothetical protein
MDSSMCGSYSSLYDPAEPRGDTDENHVRLQLLTHPKQQGKAESSGRRADRKQRSNSGGGSGYSQPSMSTPTMLATSNF